ncbi:hypothetical protein LUZ60_003689 [Juncus effusus]|nr:hypothetical protein LUZ60_003689 [Juncus effusus]
MLSGFVDPAFQGAGQNLGTEIWRIENFKPVPLPKSDYGKFYNGDSYIVLRTYGVRAGAYQYDIHFWIGKDSTQDEYATAAMKTIELDDTLGGKAIQHREIQGHESDKFLSYFKPCIIPLDGGFASGFKKHEEKYEVRLYVCKGNRIARMHEVPFKISSLNHDDVFILDTDSKIYQFNGATSSIQERAKALEVTPYLKDKFHGGRDCHFAIIEDGECGRDSNSSEFWGYFGGFSPIDEKAYDEESIVPQNNRASIYSVKDDQLKLEENVNSKEKLEINKCYLLDCGTELFIWVGRQASVEERKTVNKLAEELLKKDNRSKNTSLTRLVQGYETSAFKSKFESWSQNTELDLVRLESFNANGTPKGNGELEETPQLLEGNGELEVWCINGREKILISKEEIGKFYSGDCYIVLYKYQSSNKNEEEYFLASWIGKHSIQEDQVMASKLANEIWDDWKGKPVHGRIYEGKEPPHFVALFQPMVILKGGMSSGYKKFIQEKKHTDRTYCSEGMALIQISRTSIHNNIAIQVHAVAESLCSFYCFMLQVGDSLYIWKGKSSNIEQLKLTEKIAEFLKPGVEIKQEREGNESCAFWSFLHGKRNFAKRINKQEIIKDPHLFSFSLKKRKLEVSEIYNFSQDDLLTEDILILNTQAEVFIWIGRSVDQKEKQKAFDFDLAQKYIEQAILLEGLSADVPLYKVTEGNEPSFFTSNFPNWDARKANIPGNSYEKKKALLFKITRKLTMLARGKSMKSSEKETRASARWGIVKDAMRSSSLFQLEETIEESGETASIFSYEQLKAHSENPVSGIDFKQREVYLSDAEFETVFGMKKNKFYNQPKWKQNRQKREADLF